MKHKKEGVIIIGLAVAIVLIVLFFNQGFNEVKGEYCNNKAPCPVNGVVSIQTWASLTGAILLFLLGLFLILARSHEKINMDHLHHHRDRIRRMIPKNNLALKKRKIVVTKKRFIRKRR